MGKVVILFFVLVLCAIAGYFHFLHNVVHIEVPSESIARALPKKDGAISHDYVFVLKNYGFKKIRLEHITASCSCTRVDCPGVIKPFSSAKISANVQYNARELGGRSVDLLLVNSSREPVIKHSFHVESENYYSIIPASLNFGRFFAETHASMDLSILMASDLDTLPKISIETLPEGFGASLIEVVGSARERIHQDGSRSVLRRWILTLNPSERLAKGKGVGILELKLAGDCDYKAEIPVKWEIMADAFFDAEKYIFSLSQQELVLSLTYNKKNLSEPEVFLENNSFRLVGSRNTENGIAYTIKYNTDGQIGTRIVPFKVKFGDGTIVSASLGYSDSLSPE